MATIHQLAACCGINESRAAGSAETFRPVSLMEETEALEKDLEVLAMTVAEIVHRLAPVLTPSPPAACGVAAEIGSSRPSSPHCDRLASLRNKVMSIRDHIADAASRLSV